MKLVSYRISRQGESRARTVPEPKTSRREPSSRPLTTSFTVGKKDGDISSVDRMREPRKKPTSEISLGNGDVLGETLEVKFSASMFTSESKDRVASDTGENDRVGTERGSDEFRS